MNHNFKPGDMALVVGFRVTPVNMGKVVELVEFLRSGAESAWKHPELGTVQNSTGRDLWLVAGDSLVTVDFGAIGCAVIHERYLMPLRGHQLGAAQHARGISQ